MCGPGADERAGRMQLDRLIPATLVQHEPAGEGSVVLMKGRGGFWEGRVLLFGCTSPFY